MAAPGGNYLIQDKLKTPAAHHESFAKLWETKWKKPVSRISHSTVATLQLTHGQAEMGVYPFMFGTAKDFEPIVEEMTKVSTKPLH